MKASIVKSSSSEQANFREGPVIVVFPFDQPYLPEFESFGLFQNRKCIILTNSKDVISRLYSKVEIIDPQFVLLPFNKWLLYKFCYSRSLEGVIRKSKPVAVVTFELYSTLSHQVSKISMRSSFTHIVISYDTVPTRNSLWGLFLPTRLMARVVSLHADKFIGLSKRIGYALEQSGVDKAKIKLVYPGVESQSIRPAQGLSNGRKTSPFRILFLGRLRVNKGIETLIAAFSSLRSGGIGDLELVVAGNGPQEDLVKQMAKQVDGMRFVGLLHGEDKSNAYIGSDLFVYPSEDVIYLSRFVRWEEQTAAAVREAMSYGRPVIVSDSGSLPEIVGRKDVVFKQRDIADLKRKIMMLYNSSSLREEIGEFNLLRSRQLFPIDSVARTVEQSLQGP